MPTKTYETTARAAIEDGASEITDLADEMRSWFDNMPENFQNGERGEAVEQAADALEQCELPHLAQQLSDLLDACGGSPAIPGCPEHVVGRKCPRCRWSGALRAQETPQLIESDTFEPRQHTYQTGSKEIVRWEARVARVGSFFWFAEGEHPDADAIAKAQREARVFWWNEAERIASYNDEYGTVPARLPDEPARAALEGFEEAFDALKITLPTGRRRPSRAARLDAALGAVREGVEALAHMLQKWKDDDRAQAATELLGELASACDELDGNVEFPGMYG